MNNIKQHSCVPAGFVLSYLAVDDLLGARGHDDFIVCYWLITCRACLRPVTLCFNGGSSRVSICQGLSPKWTPLHRFGTQCGYQLLNQQSAGGLSLRPVCTWIKRAACMYWLDRIRQSSTIIGRARNAFNRNCKDSGTRAGSCVFPVLACYNFF